MIQYNFKRIFKARGIDKPFSYLTKAGFSVSFSSKVKNNKISRLDTRMIERLCILFRCTPNDLMEWTPDNENEVDKEHPIHQIRKSDKIVDITRTLNSVPISQLDEIEQLIKDKVATPPNSAS